jgi:hypothetical protein
MQAQYLIEIIMYEVPRKMLGVINQGAIRCETLDSTKTHVV